MRLMSTALRLASAPAAGSSIFIRRTLVLDLKTASASGVKSVAISTSTNCLTTSCAALPSSGRLKAMMPPNALVGSVWKALL